MGNKEEFMEYARKRIQEKQELKKKGEQDAIAFLVNYKKRHRK